MMDVKTKDALSAFQKTADQFNQYDTITADLKQVEQELAASKIGIEFWRSPGDLVLKTVAYDEDDMPKGVPANYDQYYEVCQLGWAKLNARWQLALRYTIEWYDVDPVGGTMGSLETSRQPLAQATRSIRVKAAAALPYFLEAFDKQVREYSGDIEE
jgi:hypothetical protein